MTITDLRQLQTAMILAELEYKRADPDVVHIAHAELKAKRFAYNGAAGEYVSELLESQP